MSSETLTYWVSDVFESITDYQEVEVSYNFFEEVADSLAGYKIDEADIETEINRKLIKLGYNYNFEECVWVKPTV